MTLTTEEDDAILDVRAEDIDCVLADDAFGQFAILSASETDFIQAGNDWQPGSKCEQFLQRHDSDPWVLEYRDGASGRQFRTADWVTLEQVRLAFQSYLTGGDDWRAAHEWQELDL